MKRGRWYYGFPALYELPFLLPPHIIWRRRATKAILDEVSNIDVTSGSVLEIGSGSGKLSERLAKQLRGMSIYAIDLSAGMVEFAQRRTRLGNLRFVSMDFFDLPKSKVGEGEFEVVVSLNSWCFFSLEESVRILRRVSKRGAYFLAVTYGPSVWSRFHSGVLSSVLRVPIYLHRPSEFVRALKKGGFEGEWRWVDRIEGSYLVKARAVE